MNINELTIGQAREIAALVAGEAPQLNSSLGTQFIGRKCIIRATNAGVFFGEVSSVRDGECVLKYSRRIWSWEGAFTLSAVATNGVRDAKLSVEEPEKFVREVIEIIPCCPAVIKQLEEMEDHNG